jgi:hypothetical protein
MSFCATLESFQIEGSSALAFSSSSFRRETSGSKMPPQQGQRLPDLLGDGFHFSAHQMNHKLNARDPDGRAAGSDK